MQSQVRVVKRSARIVLYTTLDCALHMVSNRSSEFPCSLRLYGDHLLTSRRLLKRAVTGAFPQLFHVAHRWRAEQSLVLTGEL